MDELFVCDVKQCSRNGKPSCKPGEVCTKVTLGSRTVVNVEHWDSTENDNN